MDTLSPPPTKAPEGSFVWSQWFSKASEAINLLLLIHSKAGSPTTADISSGNWAIYKNTTTGTLKLWANDGGVMKSVTLT